MAYRTMNIRSLIEKAERDELCLPAIQRKYVWKPEQIEKLFDSLYQGYPIGTFLMWNVPADQINEFKFYSFLKNFHELDGNFNDLNVVDPNRPVVSVLDGQQRITSLFIAMKGKYTEIKRNREKVKELYFNLIGYFGAEEEKKYFKLLTEEDARKDKGAVWLKVGDFLDQRWTPFLNSHTIDFGLWNTITREHPQAAAIEAVKNAIQYGDMKLIGALKRLVEMIHSDENISYYKVEGSEGLDTVTEIFIRINSGGKVLSKSDLLFSTVVSRWQEGREKIDDLLKELKDMGFDMDTDFVMRTCLYLTGSPILFKVGNFNNNTVTKIIETFETEGDQLDIKTSILQTFAYLKQELGIYDKLLKSKNVLIPLIYHVYKGGILDQTTLREVQQYLYVSLLQGVFGSHGDTLLAQMREGVSNRWGAFTAVGQPFNFEILISKVTEKAKIDAYRITEPVLVSWLKKKEEEAFMVLSLAYGTSLPFAYNAYTLGTLHPLHFFKKSAFPEGEFAEINALTKLVPALMFVSARDMELRKEDHALPTYIHTILPARGINPQEYKDLHLIGATDSLELLQFKGFFEARAQRILGILSDLLINPTTVPPTDGDDEDEDDFESDEVTPTPPSGGVGHSKGQATAQTHVNETSEEIKKTTDKDSNYFAFREVLENDYFIDERISLKDENLSLFQNRATNKFGIYNLLENNWVNHEGIIYEDEYTDISYKPYKTKAGKKYFIITYSRTSKPDQTSFYVFLPVGYQNIDGYFIRAAKWDQLKLQLVRDENPENTNTDYDPEEEDENFFGKTTKPSFWTSLSLTDDSEEEKSNPTSEEQAPVTQTSDSSQLNIIPQELERLKELYRNLNETELYFIPAGDYLLKDIYDQVKLKFPELCNDAYLCSQHCLSGNKAPEWEHRVRSYMSSKKDRPNSRVRRTLDGKKWKLI